MANFSNRAINLQSSPIRKLSPLAAETVKRGKKIYHLNIGQPDVPTPKLYFDAVRGFDKKVLGYVDSQGIPETIDSFRRYYQRCGIDFDREEMIVTNGGSEAVMFSVMTVADNGDNILIPEPFYTNYNSFTQIAGVSVSTIVTKAENGFHLPPKEEIERSITKRTKAILLSNPGNPTGVVYTKHEMETIASLAEEHDLFIIADEVYREFVYDGLPYTSFMSMDGIGNRVILVDSISKRYSACGARIGIVASHNKEFMRLMLKFAQSRLCISTIDQVGAAALADTPPDYFSAVNAQYQLRRDTVYDALRSVPGVLCRKPTGAFYIMAKLPVRNAEDFAKFLLCDFDVNNETVMLAPAEGFYATPGLGRDEVRISYCIDAEDIKKAIHILKKGLEAYNG